MATGRDYNGLKLYLEPYLEEIVSELLPNGKLVGERWVVGAADGTEGGSADFHFGKGLWRDWSQDERAGSIIDLWIHHHQCMKREAYDALAQRYSFGDPSAAPVAKPKIRQERREIPAVPVPSEYGLPDLEPGTFWIYRDTQGRIVFYVQRTEVEGGKIVRPWRWDGERRQWISRGWPPPRPLYNLPTIVANPGATILLVEGEKTAEAAIRLDPPEHAVVVTTWPGGTSNVKNTDWSPLARRQVTLVPDNDQPGIDAMNRISRILVELGCKVKLACPDDQAPGWDIADHDWSSWRELVAFLKNRVTPLKTAPVASLPELPVSMGGSGKPALRAIDGGKGRSNGNAAVADEPAPVAPPKASVWAKLGLDLGRNDSPYCNEANVIRAFEGIPELGEHFWMDTFYNDDLTDWNGELRSVGEGDVTEITAFLQSVLGMHGMRSHIVHRAVQRWCENHKRDEPVDWMASLQWDGHPRVDTFFQRLLGVETTRYSTMVGRNLWLSLAARLIKPGCKQDYMVILEGGQGDRKSWAWELIGSPLGERRSWYCETKYRVGTTDFWMAMEGIAILNLDELDSVNGVSQGALKSALSCKTDRYRVKYGRKTKNQRRRCIWVGTTNKDEYLLDATGNRRYWPLKVGAIDLEGIANEIEQCYAEAFARVSSGEPWHMIDNIDAAREQEIRREQDSWEEPIAEYLLNKSRVKIHDVATDAIKLELGRVGLREQRRIARCLRVLNWRLRNVRVGDKQKKFWCAPDYADRGNPELLAGDDGEEF